MTGIPCVQLRIQERRASIDSSNTIERISRTIRTNRHTGLGNQLPIHVSNAPRYRRPLLQVPRESFKRTNVNAIHLASSSLSPPKNRSKFHRHRDQIGTRTTRQKEEEELTLRVRTEAVGLKSRRP